VRLRVNDIEYDLEVAADARLAGVLRHDLGLRRTKIGCGYGQCSSYVVLLDSRPVRSCVWHARRAEGRNVLTIERLAASWSDPVELHPLRKALVEHSAVQCGFCAPGVIMAAAALWNKMVASGDVPADEAIRRALARNACRCTGYASTLRSVRSAIHGCRTGEPLPPIEVETVEPLQVISRSYPRPDALARVIRHRRTTRQ
jgi:aerobic-type carbon monoxide dehydrogenase small subunit (CoxS/CutS family)